MNEPQLRILGNILSIEVPFKLKRQGGRKYIVLPKNAHLFPSQRKPNETLVKALARAWMWQKALECGKPPSIEALALKNNIDKSYVSHILRLNLLSPSIQQAILEGTQPRPLRLQDMFRAFPECWEEQAKHFGFE